MPEMAVVRPRACARGCRRKGKSPIGATVPRRRGSRPAGALLVVGGLSTGLRPCLFANALRADLLRRRDHYLGQLDSPIASFAKWIIHLTPARVGKGGAHRQLPRRGSTRAIAPGGGVENSHGRKPVVAGRRQRRSPIGATGDRRRGSRPAGAPVDRRFAVHGLAPVAICRRPSG